MDLRALILASISLLSSCGEKQLISEDEAIDIATAAASKKFPRSVINRDQAQPWLYEPRKYESAWMVRYLPPGEKLMITVIVQADNGEVLVVYGDWPGGPNRG